MGSFGSVEGPQGVPVSRLMVRDKKILTTSAEHPRKVGGGGGGGNMNAFTFLQTTPEATPKPQIKCRLGGSYLPLLSKWNLQTFCACFESAG